MQPLASPGVLPLRWTRRSIEVYGMRLLMVNVDPDRLLVQAGLQSRARVQTRHEGRRRQCQICQVFVLHFCTRKALRSVLSRPSSILAPSASRALSVAWCKICIVQYVHVCNIMSDNIYASAYFPKVLPGTYRAYVIGDVHMHVRWEITILSSVSSCV